jgi:N4-gp56 family major capsid protein
MTTYATTGFTQATGSPLTPKLVIPGLIAVEAEKKSYFSRFMGKGKDSIIQVIEALKKEAGDQVTVALRLKITGDGVTSGSLEDNEVSMTLKNQSIKVGQRRQAVRIQGTMVEQRSAVKLRKEAVDALSTWVAEVDDEEIMYHLSCQRGVRAGTLSTSYTGGANAFVTPDASHLLFAGGKALTTIASTDTLKATDIDTLVETAQLLDPVIQPINVDGGKYYILLISPEQATDLRQDSTWATAQRDANVRGSSNPIFSGAMGVYNGVVVHVHRNVTKMTAYGTNSISAARALFLGAQAGFHVPASDWKYTEKEFDYDDQVGFAVGHINGVAGAAFRPEGSSTDTLFGRILLDTAI